MIRSDTLPIIDIYLYLDGTVTSGGTGNGTGSGGNPIGNGTPNNGGSSRLGVREMMQRAVTAARSSLLDVEEDAPIPTLHWPPEGPGDANGVVKDHKKIILFSLSSFPFSLYVNASYTLNISHVGILCVVYLSASKNVLLWGAGLAQCKSSRLPPMWPGFDSQTRRHI